MTQSDKKRTQPELVEAVLAALPTEGPIPRDTVRVWYRFVEYLVNLAETDGWEYDGHSLTIGLPMSRLVVRGTIDGIPHVVFTSGRTPTGCMRAFLRKLEEGWLEWQVDKYRG